MNSFIIKLFEWIRSFIYFCRIVCVFFILMLLLYWIQNLTNDNWAWTNFIKPFLDFLLVSAEKISNFSFNFFGAVFEIKYLLVLVLFLVIFYILKGINYLIEGVEIFYKNTRNLYKKGEQNKLNKKLYEERKQEEKKLVKYSVYIKTTIKKKFRHQEIVIDMDNQNKIMNDFIKSKTATTHSVLNGAFLYQFDNFERIDSVLDVLFKLINSSAPIDYAICIQIENNFEQLGKLMELELYQKVYMAADTAFRYKFNESHRYYTAQVGLFQNKEKTLEVHEFKPIL